jgi:hypothetical protein
MVTEPLLEDVAVERHIILEEALEDIGEHGDEINPDVVVSRLLWPNHPLGEPVIGDSDGISNIDTDDLRQHLAQWYVPANAVLVGVVPVTRASEFVTTYDSPAGTTTSAHAGADTQRQSTHATIDFVFISTLPAE